MQRCVTRFLAIMICLYSSIALHAQPSRLSFKFGLENIPSSLIVRLKNMRIGLITNQTGKDQAGRATLEVLRNYGISIQVLLVPEHGLTGLVQAEHQVVDTVDAQSGLPVISLYTAGAGKAIQETTMHNLDALIFDIQDSGMRHYTYISTLFEVLKASARYNKQLIVLDRPNPLGMVMEGPLVDQDLLSFISIAPIPVRHGMTVGELAGFFNLHMLENPASLYVVPMRNYQRHHGIALADHFALSPNITNRAACYGYSFLGLLGEVRPFHTCRGTDKTLQCIMLPDNVVNNEVWRDMQHLLRKYHIESVPYAYTNKQTKKSYKGLHMAIADINKVSSWTVFLTVLHFFKKAGVPLTFSPAFDKAVGTRQVQAFLMGAITERELQQSISSQVQQFYTRVRPLLIYLPYPLLLSRVA